MGTEGPSVPLKEAVRHTTPGGAQAASCHQESRDCCQVAWLWRWLVAAFAWMTAHGEMDGHHQLLSCRVLGSWW